MKRILMACLVFAAPTLGCGSSGGSLALELTDAPPDTDNMASVVVTLSRVEAHVAGMDENKDGDPNDSSIDDDGKWVSLTPANKEFDLLKLQNDVTTSLGELDLPEGKITQIRLFIDESGKNQITLKTNQTCALDLKEVEKKGIKINHPFKALAVAKDQQAKVVLDFDLRSSVEKDGDCAYRLKPVIKIKSSSVGEKSDDKGKADDSKK